MCIFTSRLCHPHGSRVAKTNGSTHGSTTRLCHPTAMRVAVLPWAAVCCIVMPHAAAYCRALFCAAVCCSDIGPLVAVHLWSGVLLFVGVYCSSLGPCVAVSMGRGREKGEFSHNYYSYYYPIVTMGHGSKRGVFPLSSVLLAHYNAH